MHQGFKIIIHSFLLFSFLLSAKAQESNWLFLGYLSNMSSADFSADTLRFDNQLHNRLRLQWDNQKSWRLKLEMRNRLFIGDTPNAFIFFDEVLDTGNDYFDLSVSFPDKRRSWKLHSIIDRAFVEYNRNDWEIRLGRQRINWGVNLVWNPHDLFNAFAFFDFDYVERPGTDALSIKKYTGFASSFEFVSNLSDDLDRAIWAGLYKFNVAQYDYQVYLAKALQDISLGFAWSGNIKNAGFKGELSLFQPYTNTNERSTAFAGSLGWDYVYESGLYMASSLLYTSDTANELNVLGFSFSNNTSVSARTLSPFSWSILYQLGYNITPLLRSSFALLYFPGKRHALFINPSIDYSITDKLDLSFIVQLYADQPVDSYSFVAKLIYLRLKTNF